MQVTAESTVSRTTTLGTGAAAEERLWFGGHQSLWLCWSGCSKPTLGLDHDRPFHPLSVRVLSVRVLSVRY